MKFFTTLVAAVSMATSVFAADAENTLVIEVAGKKTGTIEIELLPDVAPNHVKRIKRLAREGRYNNIAFHRALSGFMVQTGDVQNGKIEDYNPRFAGTGGSGLPKLKAEFSNIKYETGVVGMARTSEINSADSQFFIMLNEYPSLNGEYTVFGRVLTGQNVVKGIKRGRQSDGGAVAKPDYMSKVYIKSDQ